MIAEPTPPMYLSRDQAAQAAGVCARTLDAAIQAGELKSFRVGRRVLLKPEDIRLWIESPTKKETPAATGVKGGKLV